MKQQLNFAFTGPESSGKSTLSKALAQLYKGTFHPEYAREFLTLTNGKYELIDLDTIAVGQKDQWKKNETNLNFYDTEMLVIKIWSEFKYNQCSDIISNAFLNQQVNHYFLCFPDIPYEYDQFRENENDRFELFELYLKTLKEHKLPYSIIKGSLNERIKKCSEIIAPPLK